MQGNDADKAKEAFQTMIKKVPTRVIVITGVIFFYFNILSAMGAGRRGTKRHCS